MKRWRSLLIIVALGLAAALLLAGCFCCGSQLRTVSDAFSATGALDSWGFFWGSTASVSIETDPDTGSSALFGDNIAYMYRPDADFTNGEVSVDARQVIEDRGGSYPVYGVLARVNGNISSGSYYALGINLNGGGHEFNLERFAGGSSVGVDSWTLPPDFDYTVYHSIRLRISGNVLSCYLDGDLKFTVTDTSLDYLPGPGTWGVYISGGEIFMDDFLATELP